VAFLLFSADMIVQFSLKLALVLNVPVIVVGLVLVSIGTTLPELALEIEAIRKHQSEMVFGNLLGSIVANSTLVVGTVVLISPITIKGFDEYLLATLVFIIAFGLFYFFVRTKRRLERWEGLVLLIVYLLFFLAEFWLE